MYKFVTLNDIKSGHHETLEEQMTYVGSDSQEKIPDSIILTIESVGKYESISVVRKGLDVLKNKLKNIQRLIQDSNPIEVVDEKVVGGYTRLTIDTDKTMPNMIKLVIEKEDHTLGNILESMCLKKIKTLLKSPEDILECLCCYNKPHPLLDSIEFTLKTPQKELEFTDRKFRHVTNQPLRLVLVTLEDVIEICEKLRV